MTHDGEMRILVVDRNGEFSADIARAAARIEPAPQVVRLRRPTRALRAANSTHANVIVASPEEMTQTGLRRLARIHRADPRTVLLLAVNGHPLPAEDVGACGASEVIHYPASNAKMKNALQRAIEMASDLNEAPDNNVWEVPEVQRDDLTTADDPVQPAIEVAAAKSVPPASTSHAHVVSVTSASGGCGKTFYATNFAAYLAKATKGRILLLDLDLQFGEVAVALRIRPTATIADLIETDDIAGGLSEHVVTHAEGFDVLCAPKDPVAAERVGPIQATAIIDAASLVYDYIVVDTPPSLNEVVLAAFDRSQALVVMATLDIPSLKNMKVFLQTLERLHLETSDIRLVLNKAQDGTGLNLREVLSLYEFSAVLPYASEVTRSINRGKPVLSSDPDSTIARKFVDGARVLVRPAVGVELPWTASTNTSRPTWFSRLLKKGAKS